MDEDPLGLTLLEKDPLPEAARLVALLSAHAGAHVETHLLAFDVAVKRGKYLLAARAVVRCGGIAGVFPYLLVLHRDQVVHCVCENRTKCSIVDHQEEKISVQLTEEK